MKPLEELGISPTPWKFILRDEIGADVKCSWRGIARKRRHTVVVRDAYVDDARLIAAAPKLYKAVYELLEIVCDDCQSRVIPISENRCTVCPRVQRARAALAEAAGESEVRNGK